MTPPASLHFRRNSDTRSILAVVQAASEKRLALVTGKYDLINAEGVVIRTRRAGIPDSALSEIKKSYPDLNTDYVFCPGCYTVSPYHPATFALALWGGAL